MVRLLVTLGCFTLALAFVASMKRDGGAFRAGLLRPLEGRGGVRFADHLVGLSLACFFTAIVLHTAPTLGFMRDEGMYFDASKSYAAWFEKLLSPDKAVRESAYTREVVDAHWAVNGEHPSLMKSSFALSWIYLWKTWPLGLIELFHRSAWTTPLAWLVAAIAKFAPKLFTEESASFRFPQMLAGGCILWITYVFGAQVSGRAAGLVAALLVATCPRLFFDAHLAAFDAAAVLAWLAVAYAYWRGLESFGWAIATGFVWGFALLTKHNSWFLPIVFLIHYVWMAYDVLRARPGAHPTFMGRARKLTIPWPFLFMGMIGPGIFIYGWPRLWFDTWGRIDWYFTFHAKHDYYNIEYLHQTYFQPPFPMSMPYLLVLATVPLVTLVAMAYGVASRWRSLLAPVLPAGMLQPIADGDDAVAGDTRDDRRRTAFFWFFNMNLPIFIIALPKVPHFGGTKHWHPAYPFLCLFAGTGLVFCAAQLARLIRREANASAEARRRWLTAGFATLLGVLVVTPAVMETKQSHPHGLSHYTPVVGGPAGGADLGLNRGFWGYETGAITDWLNQHLPNGGRVYPNDTFYSSFEQLKADKRLNANIDSEWWSVANCDVAVIEHEQHMDEVEHQIWVAFGTVTPAYVVTLEGVPTLTVYVNPKSARFVP
jgi:hypothetical protein